MKPIIGVGIYVLILAPCSVASTEQAYKLNLGHENTYLYFHVLQIKLYSREATNLQCRPCISLSVNANTLEIVKVIGYSFKFNEGRQFLYQFRDYLLEDATYHSAVDIVKPSARLLIAKYIPGITNLPQDLEAWVMRHPLLLDMTGRLASVESTSSAPSVTATPLVNRLHSWISS